MSGRSSQRKGWSGELELSRIFQAHGIPAAPGKPVSFGETPDITGIRGVHAEVKRTERLNIQEAMNQAIRDSEKFNDGMPVLFHRRNRSPWLATMRLTDWMRLYAETIGKNPEKEIDLDDAVIDGTLDLYGTSWYCDKCSRKVRSKL